MKHDSQPFEAGDRVIVTREFNSATFNYTPIKQFFNPPPGGRELIRREIRGIKRVNLSISNVFAFRHNSVRKFYY